MKRFEIFQSSLFCGLLLLLITESSSLEWGRSNHLFQGDFYGDPYKMIVRDDKDIFEDDDREEYRFYERENDLPFKDERDYTDESSITPVPIYLLPQKRGPSLSISNNIDVLRNKLREQVNLRIRNLNRNRMIRQNTNVLESLGKRRR